MTVTCSYPNSVPKKVAKLSIIALCNAASYASYSTVLFWMLVFQMTIHTSLLVLRNSVIQEPEA